MKLQNKCSLFRRDQFQKPLLFHQLDVSVRCACMCWWFTAFVSFSFQCVNQVNSRCDNKLMISMAFISFLSLLLCDIFGMLTFNYHIHFWFRCLVCTPKHTKSHKISRIIRCETLCHLIAWFVVIRMKSCVYVRVCVFCFYQNAKNRRKNKSK